MKAPKCRLCGSEHYGYEPHKFPDVEPVSESLGQYAARRSAVLNRICNQCVTKDGEIAGLRNQLEKLQPKPPKRDRAEYMKGYRDMRKRRGGSDPS